MARFESSGLVDRPVGAVFEYLAKPENDAQWSAGTRHVERTSPGPLGVGSLLRYVIRFGGARLDMRFVITDFVPDSVIAGRTLGTRLRATGRRTVEAADGHTRVAIAGELVVGGIAGRALEPVLDRVGQRQVRADFARLVARLEALPRA
jgi:carbon monoxide dehydrogenase subunit G